MTVKSHVAGLFVRYLLVAYIICRSSFFFYYFFSSALPRAVFTVAVSINQLGLLLLFSLHSPFFANILTDKQAITRAIIIIIFSVLLLLLLLERWAFTARIFDEETLT